MPCFSEPHGVRLALLAWGLAAPERALHIFNANLYVEEAKAVKTLRPPGPKAKVQFKTSPQ